MEKLADLRDKGIITDADFEAKKKELLGLYLSDHPLGELSEEMGGYVNTWTGAIGADIDQERVVVGGMAAGIRLPYIRRIRRGGDAHSLGLRTRIHTRRCQSLLFFREDFAGHGDVAPRRLAGPAGDEDHRSTSRHRPSPGLESRAHQPACRSIRSC